MKRFCRGLTHLLYSLAFATTGYAQVQLGTSVTDDQLGTFGQPDYQPDQLQLGTPVTDDGALGQPDYQPDQPLLGAPVTDDGTLEDLDYRPDHSSTHPGGQVAAQTSEQLQQLVAPNRVVSGCAGSSGSRRVDLPTEVVEAQRWMQQHSDLKAPALAQAVDQQPWDPSVRALTQFPSVLASMDRNLSWTSALGDAYVDRPQDVLDAVEVIRHKAR